MFNKRYPKAIYRQGVIRFDKGRQDNNTRVGTTGLLLYCDGVFMQFLEVLEGPLHKVTGE
ncbi:BLUF domain-containing protein [Mucilaginibacter sp. UYNi724]